MNVVVYDKHSSSNKIVFISQTHLLKGVFDKDHFIEFCKHSGMVNTKFQ